MAKKKNQAPQRTCADCIHEFPCQMWNLGNIHGMDATSCQNYETVKSSPAYLIGLMDGRSGKKTNAERIRSMSDEQLGKFLCSLFKCGNCPHDQKCYNGIQSGGNDGWLNWLRQTAEEE